MKTNIILLSMLFSLMSCGHVKFDIRGVDHDKVAEKRIENKVFWVGRSVDDLITHPGYSLMPLDKRVGTKGVEVYVFRNEGGLKSSSFCNQFGCSGSVTDVTCTHSFVVKDSVVSNHSRGGNCGDEWDSLRPIGADGLPETHPAYRLPAKH